MDLMITLSVYLPRSIFPALFALGAKILPQAADPQLQKKAYKLLPRIAASSTGVLALQDRNAELQALLLNAASTASSPCRRDRLDAIAVVIEHLPPSSLHFIPSILSEVVISAKEVNEKARSAAFELLILMGRKMQKGGTIAQNQIPHMPSDAPNVDASLEEFFTMVSAGLVGSTPHMVSASITALTRILYEFHAQLSSAVVEDLVSTMDLFLQSPNREIVRSVLGFVKVAIISLPETIVKPRLEGLVRGLMSWSHEHKARFRTKVKHIVERMIRRFGFDLVERYCPTDDKKFINNIRKTKERRKRKKDVGGADDDEQQSAPPRRKNKFESEYDNALYGSEESAEEDGSDVERENSHNPGGGANVFIVEDSDEPLDLLDRKALGHISTSRPVSSKKPPKTGKRNKVDADGKLIFGAGGDGDDDDDDDDDDDAMALDPGPGKDDEDISLEAGINAYVDAIRGRDAVQRGRGGRLKFSNKRETERKAQKEGGEDHNVEMDGRHAKQRPGVGAARQSHKPNHVRGGAKSARAARGESRDTRSGNSHTNSNANGKAKIGMNGKGGLRRDGPRSGGAARGSGIKHQQAQRRGLGVVREGRVGKTHR
jgi:ribosomal RNA-processing protein 12